MQLKAHTRRFVGWFANIRRPASGAGKSDSQTCSRCAEYDWLTRRCRTFGTTRPGASCKFWEYTS